jgi:hypothetical protein
MKQNNSNEARYSTSKTRGYLGIAIIACLSAGTACDSSEQGHVLAPLGGDLSHGPAERAAFDRTSTEGCGSLGPSEASATLMQRNPYLQNVTQDSATVVLASTSKTLEILVRRPDGSEAQRARLVADDSAAPSVGKQYAATTTNLRPGTLYCYDVLDGAGADAAVVFRGALCSAPAIDATVQFSAFGDLGKGSPDQFAVYEALKSVHSDFLLVTGDLAYDNGTLRQFEYYFFDIYKDLLALVPVFPASGNHDYQTRDGAVFREVFVLPEVSMSEGEERWYSFDWGPVHVAVLDTQVMLETQAEWLREDLDATDLPWKIVSLHKPSYSSGSHGSDDSMREIFGPVFRDHGVQLVLAGHDHHYERTFKTEGVVHVVTGGGGRGTRPVGSSSFTAFAAQVAHFVHLVADSNTLTLHAIDATGQEFDTLRLEQ